MFPVHTNESGSFQELAHKRDVVFEQLNILTIKPGFTRGGHYHTRKVEWFCCIQGRCVLKMLNIKTGEKREVKLNGKKREFIKIEPWIHHDFKNTGNLDCELLIITSEEYDADNPDTFRSEGEGE